MIEAVLFDADDTLWDYSSAMRAALHATLEELWSSHPGRASANLTVERMIAIRDRVAEELADRVHDMRTIRLAAFERALDEVGLGEEGLASDLLALYFSHQAHLVRVFDDTLPTLAALADRKLAIVSNGHANVDRYGIADRFDVVTRSIDIGLSKPDPKLITLTLDQLEVAAEEALFVGDSEDHDIAGAVGAGVRSVLVDRTGATPLTRADFVIGSLGELPDIILGLDTTG